MKLYVNNNKGQKVYLDIIASTRKELANEIGSKYFFLDNEEYSVEQVFAEKRGGNTLTGSITGGAIGALAGPVGILLGSVIGGLVGSGSDDNEKDHARIFNESKL